MIADIVDLDTLSQIVRRILRLEGDIELLKWIDMRLAGKRGDGDGSDDAATKVVHICIEDITQTNCHVLFFILSLLCLCVCSDNGQRLLRTREEDERSLSFPFYLDAVKNVSCNPSNKKKYSVN